jgi:diguanylate cyclase (GGDEF)-like protein/PAS domain S-box-containing protein
MEKNAFYKEVFSTVLGYSLDLFAYIDVNYRYQYVSNSYAHFYGFTPDELINQSPKKVFNFSTYKEVINPYLSQCVNGKKPVNFESWITTNKLEQPHFLYMSYLPHISQETGEVVGIIVIAKDVTEFKRAESILSTSANTDPLTDIPNRLYLERKLESLTQGTERSSDRFALLFCDLDGFKQVNDTHGHAVGDKVLYQVAKRLSKHIRNEDIIARYGGDEFIILVSPLVDSEVISIINEKIDRSISQPFDVAGNKINIGVSIGTSIYPDEAISVQELFNLADNRMYENKNNKSDA